MKEHVIVFDDPPKYGKGIPVIYKIQVFDIPEQKQHKVSKLLENLGFTDIKTVKLNRNNNNSYKMNCLIAKYFAGEEWLKYTSFWQKKERIELEINNLKIKKIT
jgi:hypothetical protein